MKTTYLCLLTVSLFITSFPCFASETTYIPVGTARTKKTVIALSQIQTTGNASIQKLMAETIQNDLSFMDMFKIMNNAAYIEKPSAGITLGSFSFTDWSSIGAEYLIKSALQIRPDKSLSFEGHLYDVTGAKEIFSQNYIALQGEGKLLAHQFANDVVQTLTGFPGIFLTKIAMSCERQRKKEIYTMNFDGTDVRQVTHNQSISYGPAWSPDSTRLAYSVYAHHRDGTKNIDLFEWNFITRTQRLLSARKGMNTGPAYSPDGSKIALTLSFGKNPELYLLDTSTLAVKNISHSFGFDVDPSWSPDGNSLVFVSDRTGLPMIFSMQVGSNDAQRLTYAGKYNATPSWSPLNNKIAFAGWLERHFDIFLMNPDGSNIERLTLNQGNNEDPSFSPDGNFIVFSSNRTGKKEIYVMNTDGSFVRRLTYGLGNCVSPKWSRPPRNAFVDIKTKKP